MTLMPQELWKMRNAIVQAVNESHQVLSGTAQTAKTEEKRPLGSVEKGRANTSTTAP
jgi:hypothetical protein